jgi:hypothetical protein
MAKDEYGRDWIIENGLPIVEEYAGDQITLRQLYYRLVAIGLPNNLRSYKRVVSAMTAARWDGRVDMESFVDRERDMYGQTWADHKNVEDEVESGKRQIRLWMESYHLERWSNQPEFIEVWIEKKALQGVFESPCSRRRVGLGPCKGYPSLTFLNEAKQRFEAAVEDGKEVTILYFGDHDPSGDDIPRSIEENLGRMGVDVNVERIALTADQVEDMGLPGVPPKATDSRSANWDGASVVELDAVEPRTLVQMVEEAIDAHFDEDLHNALLTRESDERRQYRDALSDYVIGLGDEGDDDDDEDDDEDDDDEDDDDEEAS